MESMLRVYPLIGDGASAVGKLNCYLSAAVSKLMPRSPRTNRFKTNWLTPAPLALPLGYHGADLRPFGRYISRDSDGRAGTDGDGLVLLC